LGKDYDLKIKTNELNPLVALIENLEKSDDTFSLVEYNYFYIGYKIPQIGKEFDLLRFDDELILNIEYKREISNIEKIKKQLLRNKYYLQFLNKRIILIGYIQKDNKLYILENDEIRELSNEELIKIIRNNDKCKEYDLNSIFKASNYLISPFNKTKQFVEQQYFLTVQQEEIEYDIFDYIEKGDKLFLIEGDAGTGKTLLVYHLAKELIKNP
jgi:RecG-like helicase